MNLLGAMTACEHDIFEVCLFFNNKLLRGNRSSKVSSTQLAAFDSPNIAPLSKFDVFLTFDKSLIMPPPNPKNKFHVHKNMEENVQVIFMTPLLSLQCLEAIMKDAKGIVMVTFGMGNYPGDRPGFLDTLKKYV